MGRTVLLLPFLALLISICQSYNPNQSQFHVFESSHLTPPQVQQQQQQPRYNFDNQEILPFERTEAQTSRFRTAISQIMRALRNAESPENRTGREFAHSGPSGSTSSQTATTKVEGRGHPEIVRLSGGKSLNSASSSESLAKLIPAPIMISSQPLKITTGGDRQGRGRSIKTVDVQGVPVIVGVRVPDSPEDALYTWRNARVIGGKLFPNDQKDMHSSSPNSGNQQVKGHVQFAANDPLGSKVQQIRHQQVSLVVPAEKKIQSAPMSFNERPRPSYASPKVSIAESPYENEIDDNGVAKKNNNWSDFDQTSRLFTEYLLRIFG